MDLCCKSDTADTSLKINLILPDFKYFSIFWSTVFTYIVLFYHFVSFSDNF